MYETEFGPWDPWTPDQVAKALEGVQAPWWIAGGWSVDLVLGRQTREHHDVDVWIRRDDQETFRAALETFDPHACDPPGALRPWAPQDDVLGPNVQDVWVRENPGGPWRFQLMLNDVDGDRWAFKRDPSINLPLDQMTIWCDGLRVLRPEVALLYKGTGSLGPRGRNEHDFEIALGVMDHAAKDWLRRALPKGHPWIHRL